MTSPRRVHGLICHGLLSTRHAEIQRLIEFIKKTLHHDPTSMLNSLQSVVMLDTASPRLVDVLSLALIFFLSLSPIVFSGNRLFRRRSHGYSAHIYEDEDGVATTESTKRNPDSVPVAILTWCLSVNALLSLTRATVSGIVNYQSPLHVWLQLSIAVSLD